MLSPARTSPFPNVTIPGLASRNYCILRVDRSFDGVMDFSGNTSYECGVRDDAAQKTRRLSANIAWRVATALSCDEALPVWRTCGLKAKGVLILREDGFSHFAGTFSMENTFADERTVVYFKGRIELIGQSGSHQQLGEACNEKDHFEGWLVGRGNRTLLD